MQSSDGVGFVWGIVSKIRERFRTTCLGTRGFASLSLARALLFPSTNRRTMPASAAIASARPRRAGLRAPHPLAGFMPAARSSRPFPRRARPPHRRAPRPESEEANGRRNPRSTCATRTSSRAVPRRPTRSPESWSTTSQRRSSSPTPPTPVRPRADTPRPLSRHPMPPLERASPRQTFRENITFSGGTRTLRIGTSETARSSTVPRSSQTEPDDPCPFLHRRRLCPHG